jgi:putative membrane protein
MFEKKRMHPISVLLFILKNIKDAVLPIIFMFILGGSGEDASTLDLLIRFGIPSVIIIFTIISGIINWFRFTYWIEDEELRIEHGLFVRKKRYIPFERIQSISVTEGLLQQIFGLAKITVETAGGALDESEAQLIAIKKEEAENIQSYIKKSKKKQSIPTEASGEQMVTIAVDTSVSEEEPVNIIYQASMKNIFLLAITSGGAIGVITAVIAFFSQFDELIPYEKIYTEAQLFIASSISLFIILSLFIIVFAYLIAIVQTMLKYYDYKVEKTEKNLIISHGLLEKRKITVPIHRIQGIEIIENPLRRLFGYVTFQVINEGGTDMEEPGKVIICPLIKKQEITAIVKSCLPDYQVDVELGTLPDRAKIRYMLRPAYVISIPVIIGGYFLRPFGWLLLVLIPLSMLFGYQSYRGAGWNMSGHQLTLRSRWIQTRTFYTFKNRIQSLEISKNWFQRRKSLGTIYSHVMSGSGRVADLDESDANAIYQWYSRTEKYEVE